MTFNLRKGAYQYRPLRKNHTGWDVVAVQSALLGGGADGHFGAQTDTVVRAFQTNNGLVVDGIAGIATQRALGKKVIGQLAGGNTLIQQLATGQVEQECGWQLGNYTKPYANGRRDLGVVQQNLEPTEDNCRKAFDTPDAIGKLITRYLTYFQKYHGQPGAKTERRAWELAAGSWNAPAWSDKLAKGQSLSATQREHIEAYIDLVTSYVEW